MRIGVVSDTHIPKRAKLLPRKLIEGLKGVDLILHA
ncbi:MAG: YfcE family phosphodiesterase, partial [Bacilli bacterium]